MPYCKECKRELDCEDTNGRDLETMGGLSVEYYVCEECNIPYELIGDNLYRTDDQS